MDDVNVNDEGVEVYECPTAVLSVSVENVDAEVEFATGCVDVAFSGGGGGRIDTGGIGMTVEEVTDSEAGGKMEDAGDSGGTGSSDDTEEVSGGAGTAGSVGTGGRVGSGGTVVG